MKRKKSIYLSLLLFLLNSNSICFSSSEYLADSASSSSSLSSSSSISPAGTTESKRHIYPIRYDQKLKIYIDDKFPEDTGPISKFYRTFELGRSAVKLQIDANNEEKAINLKLNSELENELKKLETSSSLPSTSSAFSSSASSASSSSSAYSSSTSYTSDLKAQLESLQTQFVKEGILDANMLKTVTPKNPLRLHELEWSYIYVDYPATTADKIKEMKLRLKTIDKNLQNINKRDSSFLDDNDQEYSNQYCNQYELKLAALMATIKLIDLGQLALPVVSREGNICLQIPGKHLLDFDVEISYLSLDGTPKVSDVEKKPKFNNELADEIVKTCGFESFDQYAKEVSKDLPDLNGLNLNFYLKNTYINKIEIHHVTESYKNECIAAYLYHKNLNQFREAAYYLELLAQIKLREYFFDTLLTTKINS